MNGAPGSSLTTGAFGQASERLPAGSMVKNPATNAGDLRDVGLIPGLGKSPGGGHGNPLQYSCLKNPMDRESIVLQRVRHD